MLSEHIHPELADVNHCFDQHCRTTNTDYSIDADYPNFQGYTLLKCRDFEGFIRYLYNRIKNKPIDFRVNGARVEYDKISRLPRRRNNLITFSLIPLQENDMKKKEKKTKNDKDAEVFDENQYKTADTSLARKTNPRLNSKIKHQRNAFEEAPFADRLKSALSESISFSEPEVLFTQTTHAVEDDEDETEKLEDLKEDLNNRIVKYMKLLDESNNELTISVLEEMIESCTQQINDLDNMINE